MVGPRRPARRAGSAAAPISAARAAQLRPLLLGLDATLDRAARLAADPVELPRRYRSPDDQEVAGLLAAALAYGRADLFKPILVRLLDELGPSPAAAVARFAAAPDVASLDWFRYRFNRPADLAALLAAIGHLRRAHGSLGARFQALFEAAGGGPAALRPALAGLRLGAPGGAAGGAAPPRARHGRAAPPPARRGGAGRGQALEPLPALDGAGPRRDRPGGLGRRAARGAAGAARHPRHARLALPRAHPARRRHLADGGGDHGVACASSTLRTRSASTSPSATSA